MKETDQNERQKQGGLKVHDVARATGLHENTVRKLEREGKIRASRSLAGFRIFDEEAISKIQAIYRNRQRIR